MIVIRYSGLVKIIRRHRSTSDTLHPRLLARHMIFLFLSLKSLVGNKPAPSTVAMADILFSDSTIQSSIGMCQPQSCLGSHSLVESLFPPCGISFERKCPETTTQNIMLSLHSIFYYKIFMENISLSFTLPCVHLISFDLPLTGVLLTGRQTLGYSQVLNFRLNRRL